MAARLIAAPGRSPVRRRCWAVGAIAIAVALVSVVPLLLGLPCGSWTVPPSLQEKRIKAATLQRRGAVLRSRSIIKDLGIKVGSKVQVLQKSGIWSNSDVLEVADLVIKAQYDDGHEEDNIDVRTRVRALPTPLELTVGQQMEVEHEGAWYGCKILGINEDGSTCTVKYDDGCDEEIGVDVLRRIRLPRLKLKHLTLGQHFRGQVVSLREFGAFVDIGAEQSGLVHISRMAKGHVERVEDVLQQGQYVDVWVSEVMPNKLALSMDPYVRGGPSKHRRRPSELQPFAEASIEDWFDGIVNGLESYGAFVTVRLPTGETANGLVHITEMGEGYVESVEDVLSLDQKVKVRIINVEPAAGRLILSMQDPCYEPVTGPGDIEAFEGVSAEEWLDGRIDKIMVFGAFVSVTTPDGSASASGLVHVSRLREGFVGRVRDELQVGQKVRVRVTYVDLEERKMSLSMKQPVSDANVEY